MKRKKLSSNNMSKRHQAVKRLLSFSNFATMRFEPLEERILLAADFGDAPFPFPTLEVNSNGIVGASHVDAGPILGELRDVEDNGVFSNDAQSDGDDEDGIVFGTLRQGDGKATLTATVSNAPDGAKLDGWIDFDGDGNWNAPNERVLHSAAVSNGENRLTFSIPVVATSVQTFARIRISSAGGLSQFGIAQDGEVEDYAVTIAPPIPTSLEEIGKPIGEQASTIYFDVFDFDNDGDDDIMATEFPPGGERAAVRY